MGGEGVGEAAEGSEGGRKRRRRRGVVSVQGREQRAAAGGCLDRCRLPLGSPRSSINRPPHSPALPTVGEICPETVRVVPASRAGGVVVVVVVRTEGGGAVEDGYMATFRSLLNIYTAESLGPLPLESRLVLLRAARLLLSTRDLLIDSPTFWPDTFSL